MKIKILYILNILYKKITNLFLNSFARIFIKQKIISSNKILVIRSGGLGDFLFSVPAINLLRESIDSDIEIISDGYFDGNKIQPYPWVLMLKNKIVDKIHVWDRRSLFKFIRYTLLYRKKNNTKFDAILLLSHPSDSFISKFKRLIFLSIANIKSNNIYGINENNLSSLFRKYHKYFGKVLHKIDEPLNIVKRFLCDKKQIIKKENYLLSKFQKEINDDNLSINLEKLVLISPESKLKFKAWPIEKYAHVTNFLAEKGYVIYIVGISNEKKFPLSHLCNNRNIFDMRGKFTIQELIFLTNRSLLTITNDGGFAHLASMSGGKLISIANSVEHVGVVTPVGPYSFEVRNFTECAPCYGMYKCPISNPVCVTQIPVIEVISEIKRVLKIE